MEREIYIVPKFMGPEGEEKIAKGTFIGSVDLWNIFYDNDETMAATSPIICLREYDKAPRIIVGFDFMKAIRTYGVDIFIKFCLLHEVGHIEAGHVDKCVVSHDCFDRNIHIPGCIIEMELCADIQSFKDLQMSIDEIVTVFDKINDEFGGDNELTMRRDALVNYLINNYTVAEAREARSIIVSDTMGYIIRDNEEAKMYIERLEAQIAKLLSEQSHLEEIRKTNRDLTRLQNTFDPKSLSQRITMKRQAEEAEYNLPENVEARAVTNRILAERFGV